MYFLQNKTEHSHYTQSHAESVDHHSTYILIETECTIDISLCIETVEYPDPHCLFPIVSHRVPHWNTNQSESLYLYFIRIPHYLSVSEVIEVIDWKYSTYFGQRDVHLLAHELVAVRFRFIFRTVFIRQIVTFVANAICSWSNELLVPAIMSVIAYI